MPLPTDKVPHKGDSFQRIARANKLVQVVIASGQAVSGPVDISDYIGGMLFTPSALDATTKIAFKAAYNRAGTFVPVHTSADALVELTVTLNAAYAYNLPADLFGAPFLELWTEASGADVAQAGGARTFYLWLKA